jgi:hypothetical protein
MVYNAARLKDAGQPYVREAAMAKLFASQVAERVASQCVEVFGGNGFVRDYPAEKYYRDAKVGKIYEGTSNMQLATIAKQVLAPYSSGSDVPDLLADQLRCAASQPSPEFGYTMTGLLLAPRSSAIRPGIRDGATQFTPMATVCGNSATKAAHSCSGSPWATCAPS